MHPPDRTLPRIHLAPQLSLSLSVSLSLSLSLSLLPAAAQRGASSSTRNVRARVYDAHARCVRTQVHAKHTLARQRGIDVRVTMTVSDIRKLCCCQAATPKADTSTSMLLINEEASSSDISPLTDLRKLTVRREPERWPLTRMLLSSYVSAVSR